MNTNREFKSLLRLSFLAVTGALGFSILDLIWDRKHDISTLLL